MAVYATHLAVARRFPIVIEWLHDVTNKAGFWLVCQAVGKKIDTKVPQHDNDGQCE